MATSGADEEHGGGGGADLISALPEDLLLHVLVRLRCAATAARTSLLSRRWRDLWTRLPDLVFRGVTVRSIQAVLNSLQGAGVPGVSLLEIRFPGQGLEAAAVSSLLHAAVGLSPAKLHVDLQRTLLEGLHVDLPLFHRAVSIDLLGQHLCLSLPQAGGFRALQKLSLFGCSFDLAALLLCCPCLRVLRVACASLDDSDNITVHSPSLQELALHTNTRFTDYINSIHVDAPLLKQLTLSFSTTGHKFSVSIVAPILENVSWGCFYPTVTVGFGPWSLSRIMLCVPERHHGRQRVITEEEDGCLRQLSNAYVMTLIILPHTLFEFTDEGYNLMHTIEKHLVTDFSVLELYFKSWVPRYTATSLKHVFGAFVLHLLGVCRIRNAIQRLKIVLHRLPVKEECPVNCPCDEPKNWRSENISLINLEQVEIHGFDGDDHEFDFLKVIFRCAPVLKRIVVWVSAEVAASNDRCTEIHGIFKAYPFVDCRLMEH